MCLSTIQKVHKRPLETEGWGWKVFAVSRNNTPSFQYCAEKQGFITDKWLTAKKAKISCRYPHHNKKYLTGFHIFKTKNGAESSRACRTNLVCIKVKYKQLRIIGTQDRYKCLVADKLFIPSEWQYSDGELALKA
jgi:hypothetical protein